MTSDTRATLLPDVPSMRELGLPKVNSDNWYAMISPGEAPPANREKIRAAAVEAMHTKELIDAYARAAPDRDLSGLQFWLALATWKLAIIFEGITRRRLENPGNSRTSPETLRHTTEHLAAVAASLI